MFVRNILAKIFEWCPLQSDIVKTAAVFDPANIAVVSQESLQKTLKTLLSELIHLKIISTSHGDKALLEFSNFYNKECQLRKEELKNYSEEDQRLDTFYFSEQIGIQKYENLSFVLCLLLTLSHGQSDVERNFSLKNNLEQNNQSEETIVARRMIKDHLVSHNLKPIDVVIDQPLMLAVKNARMKYGKSLRKLCQKRDRSDERERRRKKPCSKLKGTLLFLRRL